MALMNKQFIRNIPSLTKNEQEQLADRHVLVAGCGGLGGYAIEYLTRLGIGKLTVADNDEFETTNLNRQLLATHDTLGKFKVFAAEARAKAINPNIAICPWHSRIDKNTADTAIHGTDLVIDALDNAEDRLILEEACARAEIPLIHGAVVGWLAQVMVVSPGSGSLRKLYANNAYSKSKSTLTVAPAFCAAIQVSEAIKILCGRSSDLEDKVLAVDLERLEWRVGDPKEQLFEPRQIKITVKQQCNSKELEVFENTTIRQALGTLLDIPRTSVLRNGISITEAEAETAAVENGDVFTIRRGIGVGG